MNEKTSKKNQIVDEILDIDWESFQAVNEKGKAAADEDKFRKMRSCQYETWSEPHLESWLADLRKARELGNNLAAEKYIRMMKEINPSEYERLKNLLLPVEEQSLELIEKIMDIQLEWKKEMDQQYPAIMNKGRAAQSAGNAIPSFETYLRSELMTCSPATLAIYYEDIKNKKVSGGNEVKENIQNQARAAGFETLEQAEKAYAAK